MSLKGQKEVSHLLIQVTPLLERERREIVCCFLPKGREREREPLFCFLEGPLALTFASLDAWAKPLCIWRKPHALKACLVHALDDSIKHVSFLMSIGCQVQTLMSFMYSMCELKTQPSCEGHAKANEYLFSLVLGHSIPFEDKYSHAIPTYLSQEMNVYPL